MFLLEAELLKLAEDIIPWTLPSVPIGCIPDLPCTKGIYFVYQVRCVLYIGSTVSSFVGRWSTHNKVDKFLAFQRKTGTPINIGFWEITEESSVIHEVEKVLIDRWKPLYNVRDKVSPDNLMTDILDRDSVSNLAISIIGWIESTFETKAQEQQKQICEMRQKIEELTVLSEKFRYLASVLRVQRFRWENDFSQVMNQSIDLELLRQNASQDLNVSVDELIEAYEKISHQVL